MNNNCARNLLPITPRSGAPLLDAVQGQTVERIRNVFGQAGLPRCRYNPGSLQTDFDNKLYSHLLNISPQELAQRLAEADRRRVALRRATLELAALGRQLLAQRSKRESDDHRSERSRRGSARRLSGT